MGQTPWFHLLTIGGGDGLRTRRWHGNDVPKALLHGFCMVSASSGPSPSPLAALLLLQCALLLCCSAALLLCCPYCPCCHATRYCPATAASLWSRRQCLHTAKVRAAPGKRKEKASKRLGRKTKKEKRRKLSFLGKCKEPLSFHRSIDSIPESIVIHGGTKVQNSTPNW